MHDIFFSLLRLALGTQLDFPYVPSARQWRGIRKKAIKQSVLGIAFAGLQKLRADSSNNEQYAGSLEHLSKTEFAEWVNFVISIQNDNARLNRRCSEVQRTLLADAMDCIILKGQGAAALYGNMANLRQTGDIDVWVMPSATVADGKIKMNYRERRQLISEYFRSKFPAYDMSKSGIMHTEFPLFMDTIVELHFTPSTMSNPQRNARLQQWFEQQWIEMHKGGYPSEGFKTPSAEFNLVYMLQHIYKHTLFEGIGLRQIMDYYFLSLAIVNKPESIDRSRFTGLLRSLGLHDIARAVNWVMWMIFEGGQASSFLLGASCPLPAPDEGCGQLLYDMILEGGNFGHHSKYSINSRNNTGSRRLWRYVSRNAKLFRYYHNEVLWHLARKLVGGH